MVKKEADRNSVVAPELNHDAGAVYLQNTQMSRAIKVIHFIRNILLASANDFYITKYALCLIAPAGLKK